MSALSTREAVAATLVCALIIFLTRAFPFILFSRAKPPKIISFIERFIPPMVMAILAVYCFKDLDISRSPWGIPSLASLAAVVALHLWKRNSMLSIFGGTALYMLLLRVMRA